ncbi:hypothetical protein AGRA3207_002867 [Actinomadura graeca]|uniref:Hsp70 family protein n=1 Tax=Actinomadura graeca TaxID=2750812 RepID=A0ABX8QT26_9ACTN|nr:hypothetical protein [Actinomadura graeca]QXJ21950.1 hypothetical protein AGRA3207_002867 [Actinomadura graeca]
MTAEHQVAAAVDFGTHGTGWGWATIDAINDSPDHRKINYQSRHRGSPEATAKNLTALLLGADGEEVVARGFDASRKWRRMKGTAEADRHGYAYAFKMALKPEVYNGDVPRGEGTVYLRDTRDVQKLITAYLREVRSEAVADIAKRGYREEHIRWCLTVPAIWDENDRALMRDAAEKAGFPKDENSLLITREPEAAAVYCWIRHARVLGMDDAREHLDLSNTGDRFMVVDCGGGTVDITAFRVRMSPDGKPRLYEIGRPDGGKFGSEYVNAAFTDDYLTRVLGADVMERAKEHCRHDLDDLEAQWEREKVNLIVDQIDGRPRIIDPILLRMGHHLWGLLDEEDRRRLTAEYGAECGLVVREDDAQAIFDTAIAPILKTVEHQLSVMRRNDGFSDQREKLVIVGGFGRSEYLQASIHERFRDEAEVLVAEDPATAVLFGAVHFCYDPDAIRSRRSRYTIGLAVCKDFRHGVDPADSQVTGDDGLKCNTRFDRIVIADESVEVNEERVRNYFPISKDQRELGLRLFSSLEDDPEYATEETCKKLGEITVDISESEGKERGERPIRIYLSFGGNETRVRAENPRTGEIQETTFDVDYLR